MGADDGEMMFNRAYARSGQSSRRASVPAAPPCSASSVALVLPKAPHNVRRPVACWRRTRPGCVRFRANAGRAIGHFLPVDLPPGRQGVLGDSVTGRARPQRQGVGDLEHSGQARRQLSLEQRRVLCERIPHHNACQAQTQPTEPVCQRDKLPWALPVAVGVDLKKSNTAQHHFDGWRTLPLDWEQREIKGNIYRSPPSSGPKRAVGTGFKFSADPFTAQVSILDQNHAAQRVLGISLGHRLHQFVLNLPGGRVTHASVAFQGQGG